MTTSIANFTTEQFNEFILPFAITSQDEYQQLMTEYQQRQTADFYHDGDTYCLMGTEGDYDLYILDELNEWELIAFDTLSYDEMVGYADLCKAILAKGDWVAW